MLKEKFNNVKLFVGSSICSLTALATGVVAHAETSGTVGFDDFKSFFSSLTSQINITTILGVLGGVALTCVGLAFFWWGVRKVTKMVMKAFKSGQVNP